MKKNILMIVVILLSATTLMGQTESQHFVYEKHEKPNDGYMTMKPKNEINRILEKGGVLLELPSETKTSWGEYSRVKPLQELVDEGVLSKQRILELKKEDKTIINVFFDETGIVSYVYFWVIPGTKSLLTDQELYDIAQRYKGIKYDMTGAKVIESEKGSKTSFYCSDFFKLPYEDLKNSTP
ncbi:hypothetical protein [uncultured Bacteroides sp.]|uniref:hypothetical protein n=1 Tax=uncultured Bacteroides sp. TaxID=162156 RepID=UPI0025D986EF|nr:hypothetical protein [uncultured Bacteroides sp.]